MGPLVLNARLKAEEMAAGIERGIKMSRQGKQRQISRNNRKTWSCPKLLQVYGCVFQTPKSTRRATLGLWVQDWRQVLLLSLADKTRWSDRQLRLRLSCACGAEVYPRLDELWTKFSKLVLVHWKLKAQKRKKSKAERNTTLMAPQFNLLKMWMATFNKPSQGVDNTRGG